MKKIYLTILLLLAVSFSFAQEETKAATEVTKDKILKLNLTSLALTNFHLQYEQVLTPHSSFAIGASIMPERGLWGGPDEVKDLKFGGFSFTPEYRYHFSGKGAKGFYMAPYFRYAKYSTNAFQYRYENDNGTKDTLNMQEASYTSATVGLMFGAQWKLGKHITLDFWIVGVGVGSNEFEVKANGDFSPTDRQDFDKNIADLDLPIGSVSGSMTSNTAIINYENPLALRGLSICLGYVF